MIIKDSVFAQAGKQDPERTEADFRTGMIPNTVAMAEDVNTYGNWSDRDLKVVCDEIVNALKGQDITPNNSYNTADSTQLDTLFKTKMKSGFLLTGLVYENADSYPEQVGAEIRFPEMHFSFNQSVYYGNTQNDMRYATLPAQTLTANSTWEEGPVYIYVTPQGTLSHSPTPVLAVDGDSKCYLGSAFVLNGSFQADSWQFSPWLQVTSQERRESPTPTRKGGLVVPKEGLQLKIGAVEILSEGINFAENPQAPSIKMFPSKDPFTYKYMYPTYDANAPTETNVDTTHIYDMTNHQWAEIPQAQYGKFICIVPCIAPSGQTLMIPAMGLLENGLYTNVFDTVEDARNAIYSLQYELNKRAPGGDVVGGSVASRCIYLGQTLIVKVGTNDLVDTNNFASVGQVPQALAGFTEASGQTGGGSGAYIPMPEKTADDSFTAQNNAATLVTGRTDHAIQVRMPPTLPDQINQLEIKYIHQNGMQGLTFDSTVKWWGAAPTWVAGNAYNIIFEYVSGKWIGGYLTTTY